MRIELRAGMTLDVGTFSAVIAPETVIVSALNHAPDLQRFLLLYIGGSCSRILSSVHRTSQNFEVRRAFTAHQLFTALREASHTIVFVEHDPTLFDGAEPMIIPVSSALSNAGCEALVILYAPVIDRTFSILIRRADRVFEIAAAEALSVRPSYLSTCPRRHGGLHPAQRILEVS